MQAETEPFGWADRIDPSSLDPATRMEGFYNHNHRVEQDGHAYLYRRPIANSAEMDLRRIDEAAILTHLERLGYGAPRLLYQPDSKAFSLHGWIEGITLNDIHPGEERMADWIPREVARQMAALHALDPAPFAEACHDLARAPDCAAFFRAHHAFDTRVHARLWPEMREIYHRLGMPDAPFKGLDSLAEAIGQRPFCLCHSDIHRKNILIRPEAQSLSLLDWELVLVGDPVYDIAVHFHKMRYAPDQEALFVDRYAAQAALTVQPGDLRREIDLYLTLERVKSAVIDAFRLRGVLLSGRMDAAMAQREAARYARKLDKARAVWGGGEAPASAAWIIDVLTA